MAIKETINYGFSVREDVSTDDAPFADETQSTITHTGLNLSETNNADSEAGQEVTAFAQGQVVMAAGAATLNLAAAPGTFANVNLTGKYPRRMILRAPEDNADEITVAVGAANGCDCFGDDFSVTLRPGGRVMLDARGTAVAADNRTFDVSGTGTDAVDVMVTAGDEAIP